MRYKKQKTQIPNDFTILYDDRERNPWLFLQDSWKMEKKRLKVGDYTIEGYEDKIAIEKKSGIKELITDLSSANRKTFEKFLKKLSTYPVKCIIVEDPLNSPLIYSIISCLKKKSKNRLKLTARTIFYWTSLITIKYNIPMIYADRYTVKQILSEVIKAAYQKAQEI